MEGAAGGTGGRAKATTGGGGGYVLGGNGAHPIKPCASVLRPSYVLSQSNAERIAVEQGEEEVSRSSANSHAETLTETSGTSLSEAASETSTQASSSQSSSSMSGFGYSLDLGSETSLDGPPHAPPPIGQANTNGLTLSPISNANASHVHNASMASPGLGGNGADEDEDIPALSELSNGPSTDMSGSVGDSQQQEEVEQNASEKDDFPLQEDADEEGQEEDGKGTGTNLPGEDDHAVVNNSSDSPLEEPTPFARETALDRHWTDGKRFPPGAVIHGVKLTLSKKLFDKGKRGVDACNVYVQTKPPGPYPKLSMLAAKTIAVVLSWISFVLWVIIVYLLLRQSLLTAATCVRMKSPVEPEWTMPALSLSTLAMLRRTTMVSRSLVAHFAFLILCTIV